MSGNAGGGTTNRATAGVTRALRRPAPPREGDEIKVKEDLLGAARRFARDALLLAFEKAVVRLVLLVPDCELEGIGFLAM